MTLMTMFTPNQNLFNFVVFTKVQANIRYKSVQRNGDVKIRMVLAKSYKVRWILALSKHDFE